MDQRDAAISTVKTASAGATHEEVFEYNKADARTKLTESGVPDKNYTYSSGHGILNDGTNAYTHYTDGSLKSDGLFTYKTYGLGRIREIKKGINTVCKIEYDVLSRPSIVEEAGKPIRSFNYLGGFIEQESENGIASRQITSHPVTGIPIAYHSKSGTHTSLFDNRFNLIGLTDSSGNLMETYRYKPFGSPEIFDATGTIILSSSFGIEPVFGGQRFLSSTGLYLSKRRLMNPINGLFLSTDPQGYADSSSLYVYVAQNPIDLIDPEGELAFITGLLIAAVVGAVLSGGINAARQGIAISEGSQEGWEWGQAGASVGIGALAGPLLVVAPELAVPLAVYGVGNGISGIAEGNYGTGAFDIAASLAPFGFKGIRNATFGKGTRYGQMRGQGKSASWGNRFNRFNEVGNVALDRGSGIWNRKFYHGALETDAQSAVSNISAHLESVRIIQEYGVATNHLGKGLYFGESPGSPNIPGSAAWWARRGGSLGRPGSGAILELSVPRWRIPSIRKMPGVEMVVPQAGFDVPQTFFPFEGGGLLQNWVI